MFYTYLWLREDGTPYYVGKGSGKRARTNWEHGVHRPAFKDRIIIQDFESEKDAFAAEMFLIDYYGRQDLGTGTLRNLTDGGENPPNHKGRKKTEAHKKKIGDSQRGSKGFWFGKKASSKTKKLLSFQRLGKKQNPLWVAKRIASRLKTLRERESTCKAKTESLPGDRN